MANDEEGVIARLQEVRSAVIDPAIAAEGGRIFKTMGDGLLMEFTSPIGAVRAALSLQQDMAEREHDNPKDTRLRFRIGINLGDVVIDGDDVLGDAVNVASRLESLAPIGGICIGRTVFENSQGHVEARMIELGPQVVKNIPQPVEAWIVEVAGAECAAVGREPPGASLAVLPLEVISRDPDAKLIADGLVQDLTGALGRFGWIFVTARNSAYAVGETDDAIDEIARKLNVRHIVQGSFRLFGERIRLVARLVDTRTGRFVLDETWDRRLDDIFEVQEQLATRVAATLAPKIMGSEIQNVRNRQDPILDAWRRFVKALGDYYDFEPTKNLKAINGFEEAINLDETFALPKAYLSKALFTQVWLGWSDSTSGEIERAEEIARDAIAATHDLAEGHYALSCALFWQGRVSEALHAINRCVELNPHFADGHLVRSQLLTCLGRFDEALPQARLALDLSPSDPLRWAFLGNLADALFGAERWTDAVQAAEQACEERSDYRWGWLMLAAASAKCGDKERAKEAFSQAQDPEAMIAAFPFSREIDRRRLRDAVRLVHPGE